jgi:hypothetical protein
MVVTLRRLLLRALPDWVTDDILGKAHLRLEIEARGWLGYSELKKRRTKEKVKKSSGEDAPRLRL